MAFDVAKIQERIDLTAASGVEVSDQTGGIRFQNMLEVLEFSKMMAIAETAVPKHLRGNPGMCLAVCVQALEWRFSPFAVANKSYVVNDRIGYESQLVHAVIEQRAPITGRLRHKFDGEGDERRCIVSATLRETGETLEYISPPFGKITPKNSPLWKTKPDLQLYYNTSRDFCRAYFPDVLLGVYAQDELRDHIGPDNAKDVNEKPDIASRLKGGKGRGFSQQHVERETGGTSTIETADQTSVPADAEAATGPASAASPQSSQATPVPPVTKPETDPAPDMVSPDQSGAGALSGEPAPPAEHGPAGEPVQAGGVASNTAQSDAAGLPPGWEFEYAKALSRASKPTILPKRATEFWAPHGGWVAHKSGPDASTAQAIYDAFANNFGPAGEESRNVILRELGALS